MADLWRKCGGYGGYMADNQLAELTANWPGIGHLYNEKNYECPPNQIQLFNSVFKGREDVFAVRWEKENKSGYMPAYFYDPYMYRAHKIKGGTFQNSADILLFKSPIYGRVR